MYRHYQVGATKDAKGAPTPFAALARNAATDKSMMVMGGGMVLLLFVAQEG